ncbi:AraC family transcriptional regulator, partial [Burkholderia multivorans]
LEMPAIPDSLSFHVLIAGTCWLRLPGAGSTRPSLVELAAGDLALVPHGAGHDLLSDPDSPRGPRVDLLPQDYLSESCSRLRYGGPGRTTTLICAIVAFDDPAARELVRALPPVLHVSGDSVSVASSVRE